MVDLLGQQVVHLQLLLNHPLQLLDIGVDVEVHIPYPLDLGYQLALLSQQFGVLLDSGHVGREYFFLFLQDICHFFLESKVLLTNIVVFEG